MNIALIGAPGSGKSELARQIRVKLSGRTTVVDNYVTEIEKENNIAIGQITDYVGNLAVAMGRYARERYARGYNQNVITCGTLIETAVYFAMHVVSVNASMTEDQKTEYAPRADAMMRMLSCLFQDIYLYDHIFYLPAVSADEEAAFIDKQIQAGLGGFQLVEATTLSENHLERALEILT